MILMVSSLKLYMNPMVPAVSLVLWLQVIDLSSLAARKFMVYISLTPSSLLELQCMLLEVRTHAMVDHRDDEK